MIKVECTNIMKKNDCIFITNNKIIKTDFRYIYFVHDVEKDIYGIKFFEKRIYDDLEYKKACDEINIALDITKQLNEVKERL